MLTVQNLYFQHTALPLLNGINLHIKQGDLVTILGANGTGKSTLLNCIAGILAPQRGQVLLHDRPLSAMSNKEIARHIAYVSQLPPDTYQYCVRDYVVLGRAGHLGLFDRPGAQDYALVENALAKLSIAELADKIYMQLSGGQKQLVNIAKILVQQPQLILFDEPTSALDYGNVFKTLGLIKELAEQQFAIIMTTHNPDHPMLLSRHLPYSKVALLNRRGTLDVGAADDILTQENLTALYHTDLHVLDVPLLERKICALKSI